MTGPDGTADERANDDATSDDEQRQGTGRRGPRAVLAAGILVGVVYAVGLSTVRPAQVGIASDVYYHAARAVLDGGDLYATTPPAHPGYRFLYPPVVVLAFLPYGLSGDPAVAYALQTAANLVAAGGIAALSVRTVRRTGVSLYRRDRVLVWGFALVSVHTAANLVMGQVNLPLALGIALGGYLLTFEGSTGPGIPRREALAGVALGLAALVKVFPALVGAWLLRRRAWTAIAAATATGTGLLAAGAVLLGPDPTVEYVTVALAREAAGATLGSPPDPAAEFVTVRRQVAALAPWIPAPARLPVGVLVLAPVVAALYRRDEGPVGRLLALEGTVLAALLLVPLEPFYLVLALYPSLPLAYLVRGRWARRAYLAGLALASSGVTLATVTESAAFLGVPDPLAAPVLAVASTAFAFVLPPTVGVWGILAGCLLSDRPGRSSG